MNETSCQNNTNNTKNNNDSDPNGFTYFRIWLYWFSRAPIEPKQKSFTTFQTDFPITNQTPMRSISTPTDKADPTGKQ